MSDRCLSRLLHVAAPLILAALACGPLAVAPTSTPVGSSAAGLPALTATPTVLLPSVEPITLPPPQPTPTPIPTPTPPYPWLDGEVRVYPGPLHYAGDRLTVEVVVQNIDRLPSDQHAVLAVDGQPLPVEPMVVHSPLRDDVLVFRWAWDTTDQAGRHRLRVTLPLNLRGEALALDFAVQILPADQRPRQERNARWTQERIPGCCVLNTISETAAHRDVDLIARQAQQAMADVESRLGFRIAGKPVPITLIDNVWGNGGYAANEVVLTYVDRSYVVPDLATTLRHELTHWAMRSRGGNAPAILSEGLAVVVAGGHYRPAPIGERAAALLDLGWYIPLADLADNFWQHQHEIAYLEAAGLVYYLIQTYDMRTFLRMYSTEQPALTGAAWLDAALQDTYNLTLDEVEARYRTWLAAHPAGGQREDVRLTVYLYDTIRRYQDLYAPYQEALPSAEEARAAGQVAEFLREPSEAENIALETMLIAAQRALAGGQYAQAEALVNAVNATLDDGNFTRELVSDYLAIVHAVSDAGYEAQQVQIVDQQAQVVAIRDWPRLETLTLTFDGKAWHITP